MLDSSLDERPEITRLTTAAGITVLVRENQANPLTAVTIAFYGGCRHETGAIAGITSLTQKLMLKSTRSRSAAEVAEQLEYLGAALSPFCYHDLFGVTVSLLSRNLRGGLALISECIREAVLEQSELDRERRSLLFEQARRRDDPVVHVMDESERLLFGDHPYGRPTQGKAESLAALSRDQLLNWYRRRVRPDCAVVAVVGDLRSAFVVDAVEEEFRSFAVPFSEEPDGRPPEVLKQRRVAHVTRGRHQAVIVLAFRGPAFGDDDFTAFNLLNAVLAGTGGRLFTELREARGLAYAVRSTVTRRRDCSLLRIHLATRPEKLEEARQCLVAEIVRVRHQLIPPAEVHRAKKYALGLFELSLQRKSVEAYQRAFHELVGGGSDFDLYAQRVRELDMTALHGIAARYLDLDRSVWVELKPSD